MPDHLGDDMRKTKNEPEQEEKEIKCNYFILQFSALSILLYALFSALDEGDIALLKTYVSAPHLFKVVWNNFCNHLYTNYGTSGLIFCLLSLCFVILT